jgi:hypothetical protein
MKRPQPDIIWVESGFGYNTQQPFVSLKLRDIAVMISPAEARDLAHNLLSCAEAAESDGFIMNFAQKDLDLPQEHATRMLMAFRKSRNLQEPPTP